MSLFLSQDFVHQFSNEYSSYVLHNDSLDPILEKQKKEEMRTKMGAEAKARVTSAESSGVASLRGYGDKGSLGGGGVELGAVRGESGGA